MSRRPSAQLPALYLITDRKRATPDLLHALEGALQGGVRLIQLREKDLPDQQRRQLAQRVLQRTRFYGAKLLLNGDPELARKIGADGVQLGVGSCSIEEARRTLGEQALIGFSAHSSQEVATAADRGADFVTFSPIYYTPSKAQYGPPQGLQALRELCRTAPLPVYALGGINCERVLEVLEAGACGIALISAILDTSDTRKTAIELQRRIASGCAPLEGEQGVD